MTLLRLTRPDDSKVSIVKEMMVTWAADAERRGLTRIQLISGSFQLVKETAEQIEKEFEK